MPTIRKLSLLLAVLLMSFVVKGQAPVANFNMSTTSGCAPLTVSFMNTSTGATSYQWSFNGPWGTSVLANPGWTFLVPGTHTVTLTATGPGGNHSVSKTVTVRDTPTVNFVANPLTVCPGSQIQFTDQSSSGGTSATYSWFLGNGTPGTSTAQNPVATYTTGPNNITLTVTNNWGCSKTITKTNYVDVHPKPTVNFTASQTNFCEGSAQPPYSSTFTASVSGGTPPYTYAWDFGPAGTGTGQTTTASFTGSAPQSYTVKLTVTDSRGCSNMFERTGYINISKVDASMTGPSAVCAGTPFSFVNTTTGSTNLFWDVTPGVSGIPGTPNLNQTLFTPGIYRIKLTAHNASGCIDTVSKLLTVHPKPTVDFTVSPTPACPAPQTMQFTAIGNASTWAWNFGGPTPNTGTGPNPTHTYNNNINYHVTLVGTSANGCKDTLMRTNAVSLYDLNLNAESDKPGDCLPAEINFSVDPGSRGIPGNYPYKNGITYTWDFGETPGQTTTTTNENIKYTYTTLGTFTVVVKALTAHGCIEYDTLTIKTGPKPTANFTVSDSIPCAGQPVQFTDLSTNALSWDWTFGDGRPNSSSSARHPVYVYDSPGVFTVTLIVNNNECRDTMVKTDYMHVKPPDAKFWIQYHCDNPKKVTFLNKSDTATSYIWDFTYPSGTHTSTQESPTFTFPNLGNFTVRLIAINNERGCQDTADSVIHLYDLNVGFETGRDEICLYDSTMLTPNITGGPVKSMAWFVNNVPIAGSPHHFNTRGQQKIKLIVEDDHKCVDSLVVNNAVLVSKPITAFTGSPRVGCVPLTVNFTDQSTVPAGATIVSRSWNFGNNTATGTAPSNTYAARGLHSVELITTDNLGCKDTLLKTDYIESKKPIADFSSANTKSCIGLPVHFIEKSTDGHSFAWDFGNGQTSTLDNTGTTYGATGQYTVRLIVTDDSGCKDTMIKTNYIELTKPTAGFTMDKSFKVCPPLVVNFTNNSANAASYSWSTGTGQTFSTTNVSDIYTSSGYYPVVMVATDANGCTDTAIQYVDVAGYAGALTYTPLTGCAPHKVDFVSKVNNIAQITWDFSDGNVVAGNGSSTISHVYNTPGTYVPKLIISDGGNCTAGSVGLDTIKVDGVLIDFDAGKLCEGQTVTFNDKSKGIFSNIQSRLWTFDNGKTSPAPVTTNYYPKAGDYMVRLEVTNQNGCKDTLDKKLTVNPLPTISAGSDTTICLTDAAQLSASGGVSYVWTPPANLTCADCPNPMATPNGKAVYTVVGTDANGCSDTDDVEILIKTKVTSVVGEGGEICEDEILQLSAEGAWEYVWTPGEGLNNAFIPDPLATPKKTTTYKVVAYEASCIPDTSYVEVVVYPKPTVKASNGQTIIAGNATTISASGERIHRFEWTPTEHIECADCPNPRVSPIKTTVYTVTTYTDFGCSDSDKVTVTVLCDESQIFIPNTFTPNGDGQNDVFYPRGNGIEMIKSFRIYNRWGEVVFQKNDFPLNSIADAWDGTYKGQQLPPDVFVYAVEAFCSDGELFSWKGDITLIR